MEGQGKQQHSSHHTIIRCWLAPRAKLVLPTPGRADDHSSESQSPNQSSRLSYEEGKQLDLSEISLCPHTDSETTFLVSRAEQHRQIKTWLINNVTDGKSLKESAALSKTWQEKGHLSPTGLQPSGKRYSFVQPGTWAGWRAVQRNPQRGPPMKKKTDLSSEITTCKQQRPASSKPYQEYTHVRGQKMKNAE